MTGRLMRVSVAGVLTILFAMWLPAQTTGTVEGTVADSSGAPVPKAIVIVRNNATGVEVRLTTNEVGYFRSADRPSGPYSIEVDHPGFKRAKVSGIKLDVNSQVRRDLELSVGEVSESVQVQASAVQVNTSNGTVATTITTEQIHTAVLNGRNYSRLAMLVPGAVYSSGSDELAGAGLSQTGSPVSINGLNNKSAGWFVDGAYDMNVGNGEANTHVPPIDSIGEVQIQTANYSARYGTTGGAVITSVTKSGTSAFHGSAYEYLRNNVMDARNFFAQSNPPLRQNQYGFSIGGPVLLPHYNHDRNKTFFFWNEEWRKRRNALTSLTTTPSDALRGGSFQSEVARTGRPLLDPATGQAFPNNTIPASRINANAALLLKTYIPLPNYSSGGFLNYINNGVAKLDTRTDTVKVDHNLTDRIRFSFVISNDAINVLQPDAGLGGSPLPVLRQYENTKGRVINASSNIVLSPHSVNEFSFYQKAFDINLIFQGDGASPDRPAGLNIKDFFAGANTRNQTPVVSFAQGWAGIGTNLLPLRPARDNNFMIADHFSYVLGKHTLQAGVSILRYYKTQSAFNSTQGNYNFDGSFTNHPIADFLLGSARTYTQGKELFTRSYAFVQTESYFQDDWRATRKLTLNLGFRMFIIPMTHVEDNLMSSFLPSAFDPGKAPAISPAGILMPGPAYDPLNGIVRPGQNGVPRGFANTFDGPAPRFGFAYDPTGNGKFSIRGGYGLSYLTSGTNQSSLVNNPPFNQNIQLQNVFLDDPSGGTPNAPRPTALNAFSPAFKRPMVASWSLTLQKELPGQILASAGYVGTRGTNWEVWIDRNAPVFGVTPGGYNFDPRLNTSGFNSNLLRPFAGYGSITQFNSGLTSTYHSLQTSVQRRFANHLALQGTYTWSKALGQAQTRRDMRVQNPLNWSADRGIEDYDRAHVFTMNYIYELPFLRNVKSFWGQVFGNWELSGIITAQSGLALAPGLSLPTAGLATRPNATGVPVAGQRTKSNWFNTAAFAAPASGMYGNAGVGVIRGPGFVILDSALAKKFLVRDKAHLSLRGEFFNTLNHTNWSGVSTSLGNGTYGQVTSARDPRRLQVALRFDF